MNIFGEAFFCLLHHILNFKLHYIRQYGIGIGLSGEKPRKKNHVYLEA